MLTLIAIGPRTLLWGALLLMVATTLACRRGEAVDDMPERVHVTIRAPDGAVVLTYRESSFDAREVPAALAGRSVQLVAQSKIKDATIEAITEQLGKANVRVVGVEMPSGIPDRPTPTK